MIECGVAEPSLTVGLLPRPAGSRPHSLNVTPSGFIMFDFS